MTTEDIDEYFGGSDWTYYKDAFSENYVKSIVLAEKVYDLFE